MNVTKNIKPVKDEQVNLLPGDNIKIKDGEKILFDLRYERNGSFTLVCERETSTLRLKVNI